MTESRGWTWAEFDKTLYSHFWQPVQSYSGTLVPYVLSDADCQSEIAILTIKVCQTLRPKSPLSQLSQCCRHTTHAWYITVETLDSECHEIMMMQ